MVDYIAHRREHDDEEQSVQQHLEEVAVIAGELASKVDCAVAGELIGLLHDFGKYSAAFQAYIGSATGAIDQDDEAYVDARLLKGKIDHSSAGAQFVWNTLRRFGKAGQGELCGQILALCIASHHSGIIDCLDIDGKPAFRKRMQKPDADVHLQECLQNGNSAVRHHAENLMGKELVRSLFSTLQNVAGMSKHPSDALSRVGAFALGMFTRFLFSCLIDADRLNSAEFEDPERKRVRLQKKAQPDWNIAIDRLETALAGFSNASDVNKIRNKISASCKNRATQAQGAYTLSVPTGGGKTLASLRYALHHARHHTLERIIYIIPYTSIIEQNAADVRAILETQDDKFPWVLEHHSNIEPQRQTWHAKLVAENWDAPIVFTTMVQFLEALFAGGTRSARRMHQLARSVLIFDEIQTLPINCTHLFCNAINFLTQHAATTAVLCTATQPLLDQLDAPQKGQLLLAENYELMDDKQELFTRLDRVNITNKCKSGGWSEDEIAELALGNFFARGNCLIVTNTKDWARRLYLACRGRVERGAIFHLSTNLYPAHRARILEQIKSRLEAGKPTLCISTQLVEAGVNISFAYVIRFLAGLDSIAQAAGRCNRHGELRDAKGHFVKGQVDVLDPDSESIDTLVDIKVGQEKSRRVFSETEAENMVAPDVIARYFKYYFFDRREDMAYPVGERGSSTLLDWLSSNPGNNCSYRNNDRMGAGKFPLLEQSFMAAGKAFKAIDAPTQAVLIPHGEGKALVAQLCGLAKEFNAHAYYEALKQAQKYSVNVFPNVWQKLMDEGAIMETQAGEGIYYLKEEYYSDDFGLSTEPVGPLTAHIF